MKIKLKVIHKDSKGEIIDMNSLEIQEQLKKKYIDIIIQQLKLKQ